MRCESRNLYSECYFLQEMVTEAFGRPGYWFLTFAQFLFPFFGMCFVCLFINLLTSLVN